MPVYNPKSLDGIQQAMSTEQAYMFGRKDSLEEVKLGAISIPVALAPAVECHGVRGFIATIIWPKDTTAGAVEIQGADRNEEEAYHPLGTITFPARQYSSPSGLVVNFMRMMVVTAPKPEKKLAGRLTIR